MTKKTYIHPSINIVCLQHRQQLLGASKVTTTSESSDVDLKYDNNGGNQEEAW